MKKNNMNTIVMFFAILVTFMGLEGSAYFSHSPNTLSQSPPQEEASDSIEWDMLYFEVNTNLIYRCGDKQKGDECLPIGATFSYSQDNTLYGYEVMLESSEFKGAYYLSTIVIFDDRDYPSDSYEVWYSSNLIGYFQPVDWDSNPNWYKFIRL